jgi:hypothetical protein|nr:MAG TPA: hypothetical protein [Caudoviricetes sp.]
MKKLKLPYKLIIWTIIGLIYLPVYISAWLLRIVARILLAIAYFGTLNGRMGVAVLKSIFSFDYERTF